MPSLVPKSACCPCRNQESPRVPPTRRGALGRLGAWAFGLGMAALGATGTLWAAATGRFLMPNVVNEPPLRFHVGYPADFPDDSVEVRFKEEYGVWLVNAVYRGKRQIYALSTVCTHLGCITLWMDGERKFRCPCHGSGFTMEGFNTEGPAPRPLERYAIHIADDGRLEVDKSRKFQEELGQWNDPASYIPT